MGSDDIQRSLGRIEGNVESLIADLQGLRVTLIDKTEELDKRLATVEKKQYAMLAIASIGFTSFIAVFKKFWS